jgi:hypothetical protein
MQSRRLLIWTRNDTLAGGRKAWIQEFLSCSAKVPTATAEYHEPRQRVSEPLRSAVGRPGGGSRSRTDNRVSAKSR